jgi:hypothetical protein
MRIAYLRFVKRPEPLCGRIDRGGIARLGSSLVMLLRRAKL